MSGMLGLQNPGEQGDITSKLESMKSVVTEVNRQFQDADKTTFVCVCISEFLSLYETERMIQELTNFHIDTHNIIVNQLLYPKKGRRGVAWKCKSYESLTDELNSLGQIPTASNVLCEIRCSRNIWTKFTTCTKISISLRSRFLPTKSGVWTTSKAFQRC
jgi:anion-transporting  ArsA/GET3 family ATPase